MSFITKLFGNIMMILLIGGAYFVGYKSGYDIMNHDCRDILSSRHLPPPAIVFVRR